MVSSNAINIGDAIDLMFATGWTDGLPVVPPTEDRVKKFVEYTDKTLVSSLPSYPLWAGRRRWNVSQ